METVWTMDYIVQFRIMHPHQWPYLNPTTKPDYCAVISKIYMKSLNQRHIPNLNIDL